MNMDSKVNLKELWGRQTVPVPDVQDIIDKANKYKKRHLTKLIFTNILLALTTVYIIWIINLAQPKMLSTRIGALLAIIAMVLYIVVYNGMIPLLLKIKNNTNIHEHLKGLLKLNAKQKFLQTTMTNLYFILLSTGMFLYMIEYTLQMKPVWMVLSYALTFTWIIFAWFYFRTRAIQKQEKAMNELIGKFEGLSRQLEE